MKSNPGKAVKAAGARAAGTAGAALRGKIPTVKGKPVKRMPTVGWATRKSGKGRST